jgi:hypothetical protein
MNAPLPTNRWQPQGMTWWYHALMDRMISEPHRNLKDFASDFGVTPACIYLVTGSDLFKLHLERRRRELRERIDGGIATKLSEVALKSLEAVDRALEAKRGTLGLVEAVDVMDKTLGRLGYGPKNGGASVAVQVNAPQQTNIVVPVSAADLEEARRALRRSEAARLIEDS